MIKLLANKIKELRLEKAKELGKRYTQADLAKEVGISRSYIGDIESNRVKPNEHIIKRIANVFGKPDDYFNEKPKKQNRPDTPEKLLYFIMLQDPMKEYTGVDIKSMDQEIVLSKMQDVLEVIKDKFSN